MGAHQGGGGQLGRPGDGEQVAQLLPEAVHPVAEAAQRLVQRGEAGVRPALSRNREHHSLSAAA